MTHMPKFSQRLATSAVPVHRPMALPAESVWRRTPPLLQMQAHWSVAAHPSYLRAAAFHWHS
jgi:hypothetical protein